MSLAIVNAREWQNLMNLQIEAGGIKQDNLPGISLLLHEVPMSLGEVNSWGPESPRV